MQLDFPTIILALTTTAAGLSLFLALARRGVPDTAGLGWWSAGLAAMAAALVLMSLRAVLPPLLAEWLAVVAANGMVIGGALLILRGAAEMAGRRLAIWPLVLLVVVWAAAVLWFTLVVPHHAWRAVVNNLAYCALATGAAAMMLTVRAPPTVWPAYRFCGLALGVQALLYAVRIVGMLIDPPTDPLRLPLIQGIGLLANLAAMVAWVVGALAIFEARRRHALEHEVAARRAVEDALRRRTTELARSNDELEQFAYVVSHDLRQPLRMVASYLSLLERRLGDRLDADGHEFLGYARDGAQRMDALILDLLAYARTGRAGLPEQAVNLAAVMDGVLARLPPAERDAVSIDGPLPTVRAPLPDLERLLANLIGNALKYRHPERAPHATISARPATPADGGPDNPPGGQVVVVRDNGIGIAAQDQERIFGIFQRLHGEADYEGSGIGLAICRKVADGLGGRLWVESVPDAGSAFHLYLPPARLV